MRSAFDDRFPAAAREFEIHLRAVQDVESAGPKRAAGLREGAGSRVPIANRSIRIDKAGQVDGAGSVVRHGHLKGDSHQLGFRSLADDVGKAAEVEAGIDSLDFVGIGLPRFDALIIVSENGVQNSGKPGEVHPVGRAVEVISINSDVVCCRRPGQGNVRGAPVGHGKHRRGGWGQV